MVERVQIEASVREIEGALQAARERARDRTVLLAAAGAGLVLAAFWWGRRKGKRTAAVVEVYKIS